MPYFIIKWNAGYGDSYLLIEDDNQDEAQECAYNMWKEEAENQADYSAKPYSDEEAELCDLTEEAEELGIYKGNSNAC